MKILSGITPLLDYTRMTQIASERALDFQQASPFPHIILDNFIDQSLALNLLSVFPTLRERPGQTPEAAMTENGKLPQPNKRWLSNQLGVDALYRQLYWELNSAPFLNFLETLTGIPHLIPDPHLAGGGVHETRRHGLLMIHADFNKHPQYKYDRRLNLLIYLNDAWQEEWGGHLELWARDMSHCEKRVSPDLARCVIFTTTRDSFHGHPHALNCPETHTRKSIALYYYTHGRPADEDPSPHKTLWRDISEPHSDI
jgi:hypothetical protein